MKTQEPTFDANNDKYASCLKEVREMYESRKDSKATRFRGIDEYLICEQEASRIGKVPTEVMIINSRKEKAAGKRALTAEETAVHEKRARQRTATRSSPRQEPKLLQEAIRSAPVAPIPKDVRKPYTREKVKPYFKSTLRHRQAESTYRPKKKDDDEEGVMLVIDENTKPPPPAFYLDSHRANLEGIMFVAVNLVRGGHCSFEDYKPRIMEGLKRVEWSGGSEWFNFCSKKIDQVEADLRALQELERVDIDKNIAEALA